MSPDTPGLTLEERLDRLIDERRRTTRWLRVIASVLVVGGLLFAALAVYTIAQHSTTTGEIQTSRIASSREGCNEASSNNGHAKARVNQLIFEAEKKAPAKFEELEVARIAFDEVVNALQPATTRNQCEQRAHQRARLRH
jgi:hypothetical protein